MKWMRDEFFPKPGTNFNRCKLRFGISYQSLGGRLVKKSTIEGFNIFLMAAAAEHLNFSIVFLPKNHKDEESIQFNLITKVQTPKSTKRYFGTQPYHYEKLVIVVPPGQLYTSFEKLFLPFEIEVWTWIIITFVVVFSTILIVNFLPPFVGDFVFGRNVVTPSLNVWIAFSGLGQTILPSRNFARFLLMCFILFSLIIRTAYQGKSFEFLQKEMRKKTVQTIDEMITKNFTLHVAEGYMSVFDFAEIFSG